MVQVAVGVQVDLPRPCPGAWAKDRDLPGRGQQPHISYRVIEYGVPVLFIVAPHYVQPGRSYARVARALRSRGAVPRLRGALGVAPALPQRGRRRVAPERVGGVTEQSVRGDDFEEMKNLVNERSQLAQELHPQVDDMLEELRLFMEKVLPELETPDFPEWVAAAA